MKTASSDRPPDYVTENFENVKLRIKNNYSLILMSISNMN
jgi:hypothetical protein